MQNRYQCPDCHKPLFEDSIHRCISQTVSAPMDFIGHEMRREKSLTFQATERIEKIDKAINPVMSY